jgi:lipopolysaccharide export LptBFGC system permease protein LptF
MEWKEHIAWISPMLATLAAFLVFYYGPALARNRTARLLVLVVFTGAFATAAIAGLFGSRARRSSPWCWASLVALALGAATLRRRSP